MVAWVAGPSGAASAGAGSLVVAFLALTVGAVAVWHWKLVLRIVVAAVFALAVTGLVVLLGPAAPGAVLPPPPPSSPSGSDVAPTEQP